MKNQQSANPIVFLDRDGVINRDPVASYVTCWEEFQFLPGVLEAIRLLNEKGFQIFIVSNQAGVGRRIYDEAALNVITQRMLEAIGKSGGQIRGIAYCLHTPEAGCSCRKPKTGLFEKLAGEHHLQLPGGYLVGDSERDIEAGKSLGLQTILVLSGKTSPKEAERLSVRPLQIANDLLDAAHSIVKGGVVL